MILWLALQAAGAYDPQGVHVDPQGVLRSRTIEPDPRLAEIRKAARGKEGPLTYISLPRLFEEARKASGPLPPDLRYLGGLTKIRYVFVYPDEKDLVIAGPAEPFDTKDAFRPLGKLSGRPVLHLDDLVTAFRAFAPGKKPDRLGCDIDITREIQDKIAAKAKAVGPAAQVVGFRKTCDQIAEAGGPQPLKFYGIDPDTRFGFVCVEADYRLKQLALGLRNKEIAQSLGISYETVKEHVQHILRKIGVTDRTQAAVWAVRKNLVSCSRVSPRLDRVSDFDKLGRAGSGFGVQGSGQKEGTAAERAGSEVSAQWQQ